MKRTDDARLPSFSRGLQCPGEPGHFPDPFPAVGHTSAWWPCAHSSLPWQLVPTPARQQGREEKPECTHTWLSNVQDLAEDQGELDAASSKGALIFVFPAAVLKDKLEEKAVDSEGSPNSGALPELPSRALPPG